MHAWKIGFFCFHPVFGFEDCGKGDAMKIKRNYCQTDTTYMCMVKMMNERIDGQENRFNDAKKFAKSWSKFWSFNDAKHKIWCHFWWKDRRETAEKRRGKKLIGAQRRYVELYRQLRLIQSPLFLKKNGWHQRPVVLHSNISILVFDKIAEGEHKIQIKRRRARAKVSLRAVRIDHSNPYNFRCCFVPTANTRTNTLWTNNSSSWIKDRIIWRVHAITFFCIVFLLVLTDAVISCSGCR